MNPSSVFSDMADAMVKILRADRYPMLPPANCERCAKLLRQNVKLRREIIELRARAARLAKLHARKGP